MYDHSGDPGITRLLSESRGFCHRHAWMIGACEDPPGSLVLALTYERLVDRLLAPSRRAGRLLPAGGARAGSREPWAVAPGHRCPACLAATRSDDTYARVFGRSLSGDGFARLYARSDGLCLAHLNRVLATAQAAVGAVVLHVHRPKIDAAVRALAAGAGCKRTLEDAVRSALSLLVGAEPCLPPTSDAPPTPAAASCAVCTLEREVEARSVTAAAAECDGHHGPSWLCARHAWWAHSLAEANLLGHAYASWLRERLQAAAEECSLKEAALRAADEDPGQESPARPIAALATDCAVCSAVEGSVRERIRSDPQALPPGGVCLRHLALHRPTAQAALEQHRQALIPTLEDLAVDLREFIRKQSWQGRHEPRGREQESWRRTISLFVGDT